MKTIDELLEAMRAEIDAAGDGPMDEEAVTRYEEMEKQVATLRTDSEVRSRQEAYETPRRTDLGVHTGTDSRDDTLDRAFNHYLRTGMANQDMQELRAQSVGTDTEGGFLVPEMFRRKLQESLLAFGGLATAVEEITTSGGEPMRWPTLDDTANVAEIVAEGTAPAGGADLVFGEAVLGAFRYIAPGAGALPLRVSVELLQDSAFDIEALVRRKLGERIARHQATHWVTGNGTTEPFGIDTGTAGTAFTAAAPTFAELLNAVHEVDPAYRSNAKWTFNDATAAMIEGIVDTTGRPLLHDAHTGIAGSPSDARLLGYPVVIDQAWPTYADGGTTRWGAFGDLRAGYVIRRVRGIQVIVNPYSRANEGQVEYTVWARADGVPQDTGAYRVLINAI